MHTKRFDAATSLWVWYGNETRTYLKLNRKADEGGWKRKHGENWQPSLKPHELTMLTARKTRLYVLPSRKGAVCIEKGGNAILNLLLQYKDCTRATCGEIDFSDAVFSFSIADPAQGIGLLYLGVSWCK